MLLLLLITFSVRPTEIAESDVFVCESIYDELKKLIRRNQQGTGLRKFTHSQLVTPDEMYHFKRPIAPIKVTFPLLFFCFHFFFVYKKIFTNDH